MYGLFQRKSETEFSLAGGESLSGSSSKGNVSFSVDTLVEEEEETRLEGIEEASKPHDEV